MLLRDQLHHGKTALSVELAKQINGEIISCDSMQIYKDMDIGTAKVTEEEKQGIKHYLVDFVLPNERYTVSNFKKDSEEAIEEILAKEYDNKVKEIFSSFDEIPIGAASIAQTHKAVLKTGEKVAVKVQRKDIYQKMTIFL